MMYKNFSVFKVFIGGGLLFAGFVGVLSFSGSLTKVYWAGLLLIGSPIFLSGWDELLVLENLGKPIPFNMLEQNQVYQVENEIPGTFLFLIKKEKEQEKEQRIAEIYQPLLKKGVRFVRIGDSITKLSP